MEYPVWWTPFLSGGLVIAIVAIIHVFIAHFAVGGGFYLVLTEMKAVREKSDHILDHVRKHTRFFVLTTMVAGGLTGVGIWFTISILSPTVTSTLTHSFAFGWAAEWAFFLGEIFALLIYHYYFDSMPRKSHIKVGWVYAFFAFMSLVVINGVITVMLTPGKWAQTHEFWDGFFNVSFWPSLSLRFALCLMFAGLFAFVTAIRIPDVPTRERMVRRAAVWVGLPFAAAALSGLWYLNVLPDPQQSMVMERSTQTPHLVQAFVPLGIVTLLLSLAIAWFKPLSVRRPLVVIVLALGLAQIGLFEWVREAGRRPYLLYGHTYSSSIRVEDVPRVVSEGILQTARWTHVKEITDDNILEAGKEIYKLQCMTCHGITGPMLSILDKTEKFSVYGMDSQLNGQGKLRLHMPPFLGTAEERMALATYIVKDLNGKVDETAAPAIRKLETTIPSFDRDTAPYVLLAWSTKGMHSVVEDGALALAPAGSDLRAQLVRRDSTPEIITGGVTITFRPENGHGPEGQFAVNDEFRAYEALDVKVTPYPVAGSFNPYPVYVVEARDEATGALLAATKTVVAASGEVACNRCHGGEWAVEDMSGVSEATQRDIFAVHDKIQGTDFTGRAAKGEVIECKSCHDGNSEIPAFSAAIHGWHANYLTDRDADACNGCHPSAPDGATQSFRGIHNMMGLSCANCHGEMEDHAIGLLKNEIDNGRYAARALLEPLTPRQVESVEDIPAREAWTQLPDCTVCHDFAEHPSPDASAFGQWTASKADLFQNRHDDMFAIMCQGCHGATHSVYMADNAWGGMDIDNIQPMQYQQMAGPIASGNNCGVCHTRELDMSESAHHPIPQ
ncbi:cytochrome ubiquinol oxidase subunit I [Oleidesulfovibrio sp.]|uniref:cytochrome ubiquinol oxidase subunit I n=1 Tax=Oleidesulfovibrio sp. TaxID=2909707 RepID=UPI003A89F9BF